MKYGYARVSTDDQKADLQIAALKKADCEYSVAVIRECLYVARKDTKESRYKYDTRIDCLLHHKKATLPSEVEYLLHNFMAIANINYGAFDLIESIAGEFFLSR